MSKTKTMMALVLSASVAWAGSAAQKLSGMDQATRENALIDLEWADPHTEDMTQAEYLWNSGRYSEAISAVEALESEQGDMCLGISWRKPIETESPKWGTDVLVTNPSYRITDIELVKAVGNNNLFVVAMGSFGADTGWTLNISTNGGTTWSETYKWTVADGYLMRDVDAAEYPGYIYVGYATSYSNSAWIRRFSENNGSYDNGFGYVSVITGSGGIRELNVEPQRMAPQQQLYYGVIDESNALLYTSSTDGGATWNPIATGVTDADRGLDMDYGAMTGAQHYLWLSYINTIGYLCVKARIAGSWEDHLNLCPVDLWYSRIAQHGDTVLVLYADTGILGELKYLITYDDGGIWYYGTIYDSTDAGAFDVTGRGGQGWQTAFCDFYSSGPETMKYRRRPYSGAWNNVQTFGDRDAYFNYNSSIDYLGSTNAYGVAYIDDDFDVWFDRIDWTDAAESAPRPLPMDFKALPGAGRITLSFALPQAGFASLKVYDVRGALVRDLSGNYEEGLNKVEFAPSGSGTFFAILAAGDQIARTKFVSAK